MFNFQNLQSFKTLYIAYSGGLDSHALLHAVNQLCKQSHIQAIHINHGLNKNATDWQQHCRTICENLNIDFEAIEVVVKPKRGESLEALARQARYAEFSKLMSKDSCLLTAHHADDQAETVLLQMLRGAGVKGLAAMPKITVFSNGHHARPLLDVNRSDLLNYAKAHQLQWIEDDSNQAMRFDRNYLRHQITPLLKQRWPSFNKTLTRVASHCAEADQLLQEMAHEDLQKVMAVSSKALSIDKLQQYSKPRQANILRHWLLHLQLPLPSLGMISRIQNEVMTARHDATPEVSWAGAECRRFRGKLYAMAPLSVLAAEYKWDLQKPLVLPIGVLDPEQLNSVKLPENCTVKVRFRQGGERFHPAGRQGSHPLKKLFQEWGVPPWLRDKIPLIYFQDRLVCVLGY